MSFKYPCFLSYAHAKETLLQSFNVQLTAALKAVFEPWGFQDNLWLDRDRTQLGSELPATLGQAICESACVVVIVTPLYFQRPICRQEFATALRVEREHLAALEGYLGKKERLIVPIIFRWDDSDALPESLADQIWADCRNFSLTNTDLKSNEVLLKQLEKLAQHVYTVFKTAARARASGNGKSFKDCSNCPLEPALEGYTLAPPGFPRAGS